MKPTERARLTSALRDQVAKIAADLRGKMRAPGPTRERAQRLHADEQVAEDFDVWTDLLSRRAAVLWVLKSVYLRVLEDRGLLSPGRLLDPEAQQLFERLAPHLGETAFLRWVYRDLASVKGGLPELFSPQPAEVALPSDELSRALIRFWRERDADTGATWSFADEHFEGELMGDLYQELDPVVKDRFALCQTPDFVRGFILDRTLTPAIETFGADDVRLLDPACGSGHFLIDGLKRLVAATAAKHPDWEREAVVNHALDRVVGIDLNDYACGLARARLVMTAAELAGKGALAEAARFHPHVYWADGLEQVERDEVKQPLQTDLFEKTEERPRATLTRADVRTALRKVFAKKFHAVVANPPYIVESDARRKAYQKEKVGSKQRYISAHKQYHLSCPFAERAFQCAVSGGHVGLIVDNQFMRSDYGRPFIEKVLANVDLSLVVDSSQAQIPHHGTATVLLFVRSQPPTNKYVRIVMSKRGELVKLADPSQGEVWKSILYGYTQVGFENEYVSVEDVDRLRLRRYPWSIVGGTTGETKRRMEVASANSLSSTVESPIGRGVRIALENVFVCHDELEVLRRSFDPSHCLAHFRGRHIRDWSSMSSERAWFPYMLSDGGVDASLSKEEWSGDFRSLWRFRTSLANRATFQGVMADAGLEWFEYMQFTKSLVQQGIQLASPRVSTHNHFALVRGRHLFNSEAPVIKLPPEADESSYLAVLGILNSSSAEFWMKQVFQPKAAGGVGRGLEPEPWMERYVRDSTKLAAMPVPAGANSTREYAVAIDKLARERAAASVVGTLSEPTWVSQSDLRLLLNRRRESDFRCLLNMVGLQEELDWLVYSLYGFDDTPTIVSPDKVEPVSPNWLPWCLSFAARDADTRAELAQERNPGALPTVWFERHRWQPLTELPPEVPHELRARIEVRRQRIRTVPALALIENPSFKRRWYCPDYEAEEKEAMQTWLADRVEAAAKDRQGVFSLDQTVASLQDDPHVLAVSELLAGRRDFNLSQLVAEALFGDMVPNHRFHVYKPAGLVKRDAWERTWEDQRREDAGEKVTPEVPPSYGSGDFLKTEYWQLRGKLDVPKERFIAFTEVPGRSGVETLYGWAGWTPVQRLRAILAIDENLEDADVPLADRIGLLDSAWRLLPDVFREDPAAAARLKAELQALVGPQGPSPELIEDWRKRFPPPSTRASKAKRAAKAREKDLENEENDE